MPQRRVTSIRGYGPKTVVSRLAATDGLLFLSVVLYVAPDRKSEPGDAAQATKDSQSNRASSFLGSDHPARAMTHSPSNLAVAGCQAPSFYRYPYREQWVSALSTLYHTRRIKSKFSDRSWPEKIFCKKGLTLAMLVGIKSLEREREYNLHFVKHKGGGMRYPYDTSFFGIKVIP